MKHLLYLLLSLIPLTGFNQQPWFKSGPLDYGWKVVGNQGFTTGHVLYLSLAFSSTGQPYVAYQDSVSPSKAKVMKFDGSNWSVVGPEFSVARTSDIRLALSPLDEPYVVYADDENPPKASVMKYDGTNWIYPGGFTGFSKGGALYTSLAFNPTDGQPYVAYQDDSDAGRATVMKYDSVYVGFDEKKEVGFSIFPNPATDHVTIESKGSLGGYGVAIVNIEGEQLILKQISNPKTVVDVSKLQKGVYFVRLTSDRTVEVGKIIKQ